MAGLLRRAAQVAVERSSMVNGFQLRGMAKKNAFYKPNVTLENWATERESVFERFKWDGDAWKSFFFYIVLLPGSLYTLISYEYQMTRRMKYGFEIDVPGIPYIKNKGSIDHCVENSQQVHEQNAGWVRGGERI